MFKGTYTALITPFRDGSLDEPAFKTLIDRQYASKINGVVPCGTTGESPTVSHAEHARVIELAIEYTRGRGEVIAGTGSNSTREAISLTIAAERAGATGSLQVCPYYNKPTQEGLYQHFKAVADAVKIPIMLYSIPGRCVIELEVETIKRLAEDCENITSVKEASGLVSRVEAIKAACPDDFQVLSGDDGQTIPFMKAGASGVVSVAGNLIPEAMATLTHKALAGNWPAAQDIHDQFVPLFEAFLKLSVNPEPIKAAMALAGHCTDEIRLPMLPLPADKLAELKTQMSDLGLLS